MRWLAFLLVMGAPLRASAATYYVAPTGSDTAAGTMAAPFASWARAQTAAAPGDTVYFRGGTYRYTTATSTCGGSTSATVDAVVLSKSGTSGNLINYWAYPGETPVFDFSGITDTTNYNCRQVGVRVAADWLYLKGLELKGTLQLNNLNHESWCVYVYGGNNNRFEQLNAHHNMGPGFFVQRGGNNVFWNCDSHENEDTLTSNGDGQSADGFGCHPNQTGDTGNLFHGCRGWWNSDDNWDFINASEACTVEYSWAWYAGYKPDAISGGAPVALSAGNGNGFKGGGYGDPQTGVPTVIPQHVIQADCAFYNKANGLYANHGPVNAFFYNDTSFNNGTDVNMLGLNGTTVTSVGMLRNNLAYSNDGHALTSNMTNGGPISDSYNSWDTNLGVTVSNADFQSLAFSPPASCPAAYAAGGTTCCADSTCFGGMASPRQSDGSLPVLPFLRLAATSNLRAKGTNVGLAYSGSAPDLGCFDYGGSGSSSSSSSTVTTSSTASTSSSTTATSSASSSAATSSTKSSSGSSTSTGPSSASSSSTTTGASSSATGASSIGSSATSSSGGASSGSGTTSSSATGSATSGSGSATTTTTGANGSSNASSGAPTGDAGAEPFTTSPTGCGCRVVKAGPTPGPAPLLAGFGLIFAAVRRRRRS